MEIIILFHSLPTTICMQFVLFKMFANISVYSINNKLLHLTHIRKAHRWFMKQVMNKINTFVYELHNVCASDMINEFIYVLHSRTHTDKFASLIKGYNFKQITFHCTVARKIKWPSCSYMNSLACKAYNYMWTFCLHQQLYLQWTIEEFIYKNSIHPYSTYTSVLYYYQSHGTVLIPHP